MTVRIKIIKSIRNKTIINNPVPLILFVFILSKNFILIHFNPILLTECESSPTPTGLKEYLVHFHGMNNFVQTITDHFEIAKLFRFQKLIQKHNIIGDTFKKLLLYILLGDTSCWIFVEFLWRCHEDIASSILDIDFDSL